MYNSPYNSPFQQPFMPQLQNMQQLPAVQVVKVNGEPGARSYQIGANSSALQNRLDDAQAALVSRNADISNLNQSQYILGQMGKWVANPAAAAA